MRQVLIVEAARSAIGKKKGSLSATHPTEMLGHVMMEALKRAGVPSSAVGQAVGGCINKVGAQSMNVTRTAWLTGGGDADVACSTVDSQCGSSQYALNLGTGLIASGAEDVVLACGVENMSLLPIGSDSIAGAKAGFGKPITRKYWDRFEFTTQFEASEQSDRLMHEGNHDHQAGDDQDEGHHDRADGGRYRSAHPLFEPPMPRQKQDHKHRRPDQRRHEWPKNEEC